MTEVALTPAALKMIEGKNFAHLATVNKDGSPQVSPVWIAMKDGKIMINTAEGRLKTLNMHRDPRVGISIADNDNPYNKAVIRGRVVEMTHDGADADIDSLAKKYMGVDVYTMHTDAEQRVTVLISPEKVSAD